MSPEEHSNKVVDLVETMSLLILFFPWCFTGLSKIALLAEVEALASFLELLLHVQILRIQIFLLNFFFFLKKSLPDLKVTMLADVFCLTSSSFFA